MIIKTANPRLGFHLRPHSAYQFNHRPEDYGKESADVNQQQNVALLIGDKDPQGNGKSKQQFGAVAIRHNEHTAGALASPRESLASLPDQLHA